jgi:hypothetical protein
MLTQVVMFLTCILESLGSNLSCDNDNLKFIMVPASP